MIAYISNLRRGAPALVLALSISSCEPTISTPQVPLEVPTAQVFSAEDIRAARALSVGASAMQPDATPYDRSLRCSLAFESLTDRFESAGQAAGQRRALSEAQRLFDSRVQADARRASKTRAQIAADRTKLKAEMASRADDARLAIGCIRQLQQEVQPPERLRSATPSES